jgi:hypothetical protein
VTQQCEDEAFPSTLGHSSGSAVPMSLNVSRWGESLAFRQLLRSSSFMGTHNSPVRYFHTKHWETDMLKGGLLWLIGIPLPIILILFFMGWLH